MSDDSSLMGSSLLGSSLIDVRLAGRQRVVGVYLVDTPDGPSLVDCGPSSTLPALREGLATHGLRVGDLRHLLLTHIHLDHAGAAGILVRENPDLQVHVAEVGLLHLAFPDVLEYSARSVYGDSYDELWGELVAIPETNLHPVGDEVAGMACLPTPGHASHHVSYLHPDGTMFVGDAAGVRILPGSHVTPPTLPPDIDVAAWLASIDEMTGRSPARLALSHYGVAEDPAEHLEQLRAQLTQWLELVTDGIDETRFVELVAAEVADRGEQVDYHKTAPMQMLYQGLLGYVQRQRAVTG